MDSEHNERAQYPPTMKQEAAAIAKCLEARERKQEDELKEAYKKGYYVGLDGWKTANADLLAERDRLLAALKRNTMTGNKYSKTRKQSACTHYRSRELPDGSVICLQCRKPFPSAEAIDQEHDERESALETKGGVS